jgi:dGTPase
MIFEESHSAEKLIQYIYREDYDALHSKLEELGIESSVIRTIDVQIMDLADEIAYAAHDLEDSLSARHFTIDELIHEFKDSKGEEEKDDFSSVSEVFENIVAKCRSEAMEARRLHSSEEFAFLFRKGLTSKLVHHFINNIGVVSSAEGDELGYCEDKKLARGLKKLIFKSILRRPDVHLYEKRGEKVIEGLFQVYSNENYNDKLRLLPPEFRKLSQENSLKRLV